MMLEGWVCPQCGSAMSPFQACCVYCQPPSQDTKWSRDALIGKNRALLEALEGCVHALRGFAYHGRYEGWDKAITVAQAAIDATRGEG
jgi:hypothetical protein